MTSSLVLRLAGPLQAWGSTSQFNRRDTDELPTKSGVVGLLAAALGRRRSDEIDDLIGLDLGVRIDQPGTLLEDYHTVSTLDGSHLLSASVNAKGAQKPTSPPKKTHVTRRYYLQDAVFVAAVSAHDPALLVALAEAVRRPVFPLALGRRACVPTQPVLLAGEGVAGLWDGDPVAVLGRVPWQAVERVQRRERREVVTLPVTADVPTGALPPGAWRDRRADLPTSFALGRRHFRTREVVHLWVDLPHRGVGVEAASAHDPFDLLEEG